MASYDSPGFPDRLPGFPARNSHDYMTAAGSAPDRPGERQETVTSGLPGSGVVLSFGGSAATDQPGQYPPREPFTGLPLDGTGAGDGHPAGPGNPNAKGAA